MSPEDAPVLVAARRTPIGTAGRSLAALTAADLAAPVIRALADDSSPPHGPTLREVVLGNCMGPGGDVARVAALQAGLPVGVPGLTVDRQCGSGLAAVVLGASRCCAPSRASCSPGEWSRRPPPRGGSGRRSTAASPTRYERAPFAPAGLGDPDMGPAADLLAREHGISRRAQDEYAARSHARAFATQQAGGFDAEIVPVAGVTADDRPRPGLSVERLARLRPAFLPDGTVTAGNSCGINDGAAARGRRRRRHAPPARRARPAGAGHRDRRGRPEPTRAWRSSRPSALALDRAGLTLDDIDVVEFNEAFAGQVLACCAALGLDPERVCPQGGALALGHPWGASGAVLAVRLFAQLVRSGPGGYGLAAIAAGGGQGVAMVVRGLSADVRPSAGPGGRRRSARRAGPPRPRTPAGRRRPPRSPPPANTAALIPPRCTIALTSCTPVSRSRWVHGGQRFIPNSSASPTANQPPDQRGQVDARRSPGCAGCRRARASAPVSAATAATSSRSISVSCFSRSGYCAQVPAAERVPVALQPGAGHQPRRPARGASARPRRRVSQISATDAGGHAGPRRPRRRRGDVVGAAGVERLARPCVAIRSTCTSSGTTVVVSRAARASSRRAPPAPRGCGRPARRPAG